MRLVEIAQRHRQVGEAHRFAAVQRLDRFDHRVDGKPGTFMIYEVGGWENCIANSRWEIVNGSGTGSCAAEHDKTVHYELTYDLPA